MHTQHHATGESILEILLAIAIFAIVLPGVLYAMGAMASSQPERNIYFDAIVATEDAKNKLQHIKARGWDSVSHNGDYVIAQDAQGADALVAISVSPTPGPEGLASFIRIEDARRDGEGRLESQGEYVDPAVKKASIFMWWNNNQNPLVTDVILARTDQIKDISYTTPQDFNNTDALFAGMETAVVDETPFLTLGSGETQAPIGLLAWWQMKGDYVASSSELDMAPGGSTNLQLVGSPTFVSGRFGNAVQLTTNSQYMSASSSASLGSSGQISMFVLLKSTSQSQDGMMIAHKMTEDGVGYSLKLDSSGRPIATVRNLSKTVQSTHADSVTNGTWQHVGFVYDGQTLTVFVDGRPSQNTGQGVAVLEATEAPLILGRDPDDSEAHFLGYIDDVQLYTIALTDEERFSLMQSTYTSSVVDLQTTALFHSVSATVSQPEHTAVRLQVAVFSPMQNSCDSAPHAFVGPDGSTRTYYERIGTGELTISGLIPNQASEDVFINPAQCFRWRAYIHSQNDYDDPQQIKLSNVQFVYSL